MLDRVADGVALIERSGHRITYVNERGCRLLGYDRAQVIGRSVDDIAPADVRAQMAARLGALDAANTIDSVAPVARTSAWPVLRADGAVALLEVSATTLDAETIVLCFRDASEQRIVEAALRKSEHQFSTLVAHSPDVIARFDRDHRCVYVSPAVESATGIPLRALVGRTHAESGLSPEHLGGWDAVLGTALAGSPREIEFSLTGPDGDRWYRCRLIPERTEEGEVESVLVIARDATDERNTMDALFHSAQRFRSLIENASDPIAVIDREGNARYLSPAYSRVLGYATGTLLGTGMLALCHPDDMALAQATLARLTTATSDETVNVQVRVRHADGSWRSFDVVGRNLLGDPAVEGIVLNSRDVTEREELARAVREAHDHFATLVQASPFAIVSVDPDYRVQSWNPAAERIFGWTADEVMGRVVPYVPEQERDAFAKSRAEVLAGGSVAREVRRLRKDGSVVHARMLLVPLMSDTAAVIGVVGFVEDITERRRAETALGEVLTALEHAAEGIARLDADGRFLSTNTACTAMLGYTAAELAGTRWLATVHPEDAPAVRAAFARLPQRESTTLTCRSVRRNGSVFQSRLTIARIVGDDGALAGYHCFRKDITEERQLEEQLRQSQKMEAVGMLAGGVAHDFNNLLTVIQVNAEFLREDVGEGTAAAGGVREIQLAAGRAATLTRQLLAFSRRQLMQPRVLDLNERVGEVESMLRRLIGEDIHIVTLLQPDLGSVIADPGQIEQVIMNLAVNARDAMPGGGTLTIRTSDVELDARMAARHGIAVEAGAYVLLSVSDTGVGMSRDTQARIFEPFFTTKDAGKGTGLGLSTAYGIVKQSGGYIWVYSEPDLGTTFKVYLPRRTGTNPMHVSGAFRVPHAGSKGTILLAEDGDAVRRLASRILSRAGYTVIEAENGRDALAAAAARDDTIDLVLTDVVMPEVNGRELVDQLRRTRPAIRVLYMSGYTDDDIVRRGLLTSDMAFLEKPFTSARLLEMVQHALLAP